MIKLGKKDHKKIKIKARAHKEMSSPCQSALKRHVDAARQIQREKTDSEKNVIACLPEIKEKLAF